MNSRRLHGLSVLRIISMLGIVGLHVLNAGGAFARENLTSLTELPLSVLYIFCAASVNTFAMLTGYLYADKPNVKYKNIVRLIFTVLFYSAAITALFAVFRREVFDSVKDVIKYLLPPLAGRFWYITCYVLLFVLIPFLNKLIDSLSLRSFRLLVILSLIFTSVLPTFLLTDFFGLSRGYCTAWLIVCYLVGAYIKRSKHDVSVRFLLMLYALCAVAVTVLSVAAWVILRSFSIYKFLVAYVSPFIVLISGVSILLFAKLDIKNTALTKVIDSLSGGSFDVYIIHSHILVFDFIITGGFAFIRDMSPVLAVPAVLISMVAVYLICWAISYLKILIFKIARIDFMADKFGNGIDTLLEKLSGDGDK